MAVTPGRKFYDEQLDYLVARDVDGLIDQHYDNDAVLVGFDFTVKGRDALKEHFRNYLKRLGHLEVKSTNKFREGDNFLFLEASVVTDLGSVDVYDAMVLRNGKIIYHFTGVK
jgi:hypothetical protein